MHEYESIEDIDDVAQGDVIEWVGTSSSSPWRTYGVVVTADCDLARGKHKGVISYVPAWPTTDFVWFHWRPEALVQASEKAFGTAAARLSTWRRKLGGQDISVEAVRIGLRRDGGERLLDTLNVVDKGQRNSLMSVIEPAEELDRVLGLDQPDLGALASAYGHVKTPAKTDKSIMLKDIQKFIDGLPGDIFHIPSMPDGRDDDLFLMLRHIRQVSADEVTARPDEIRQGSAKAKRIARVTAPFRYSITQNLAKVFSDIGLSDDYDARRRSSVARCLEGKF